MQHQPAYEQPRPEQNVHTTTRCTREKYRNITYPFLELSLEFNEQNILSTSRDTRFLNFLNVRYKRKNTKEKEKQIFVPQNNHRAR